jgi:DNA (cytosine-5)-methyltransferase 1
MTVTEPRPTTANRLAEHFELVGDAIRKRLETPGGEAVTSRAAPAGCNDQDLRGAWLQSYLRGAALKTETQRSPSVRTVELFCGPGGLALGFDQACRELGSRMESEAAVDQDTEAVKVYAANHRTKLPLGDTATRLVDYKVRGVGEQASYAQEPYLLTDDPGLEGWGRLVGEVDAVLAGPPCQGHSNLNNHSRRTDRRNELYFTVPAMAIALEADIVVIENVPAVVHDRSQVVATTRHLLQQHGYQVESGVLYAEKMGWPQTRRRFFMVGRRSAAPLPIKDVREALETGGLRSVMWAIGDLADAPFDDRLHIDTELSEENRRRIDFLFDKDIFDLPNAERPECHQDGTTYNSVYGRLHAERPAPTITTGFLTPGRGRYIHPTERRTLTPREAARLQGFPDGYKFFPDPKNAPTKAKLTKWIGDAVPMPLGFAAGLSALGNGWARPT